MKISILILPIVIIMSFAPIAAQEKMLKCAECGQERPKEGMIYWVNSRPACRGACREAYIERERLSRVTCSVCKRVFGGEDLLSEWVILNSDCMYTYYDRVWTGVCDDCDPHKLSEAELLAGKRRTHPRPGSDEKLEAMKESERQKRALGKKEIEERRSRDAESRRGTSLMLVAIFGGGGLAFAAMVGAFVLFFHWRRAKERAWAESFRANRQQQRPLGSRPDPRIRMQR